MLTDRTAFWAWERSRQRAAPPFLSALEHRASTPQGCHPTGILGDSAEGRRLPCPQAPGLLRGKAQPPSFPVPILFTSYELSHVNRCGPTQGRGSHPHLLPLPPRSAPYCVYTFQLLPPPPHPTSCTDIYSSSGTQLWPPSAYPGLLGLKDHPEENKIQRGQDLSEDLPAGMTPPSCSDPPTSRQNWQLLPWSSP